MEDLRNDQLKTYRSIGDGDYLMTFTSDQPPPSKNEEEAEEEGEEEEEDVGDDELILTIQKKASDASLIIAQNEIDILSAELESALHALAGKSDLIDDLHADLKSRESSLANLQLHYDLLTAEIEARQDVLIESEEISHSLPRETNFDEYTQSNEVAHHSGHPSPCTTIDREKTPPESTKDTFSLDANFADFRTIPDLAIAPTESTSMSSHSDSLSSTEGSDPDQQHIGDKDMYYPRDPDEEDDESMTKAMLGAKHNPSSPSSTHRPAWRYPFIKVDHTADHGGRISPLSDCSGGVYDKFGDIMIGFIEADYTFSSDMAEI